MSARPRWVLVGREKRRSAHGARVTPLPDATLPACHAAHTSKSMVFLLTFLACDNKDDSASGPPPDLPDLVINEFLARNLVTNTDEAGEYDDWVEIYNNSDASVDFEGIYLTDTDEEPTRWALPASGSIESHAFALFWCDGQYSLQGDQHTSFKLSGKGEYLGLFFAESGDTWPINEVEFEEQVDDISYARVPDGSLQWQTGTPTPGASNG